MRQLTQNMASGETRIVDAPTPKVRPGAILVRTRKTLISAGTERMLVDFSRASLVSKAMKQPARVKQVIDKARTDGLLTTLDAVRSKLGEPLPLGYCQVGEVIEVGAGVTDFVVGARVACAAPHADVVCVPQHLCALIPDQVDDDTAVFTVLGAIGLQGIRLAEPTLGERFAVIGVGLIGLLVVQFLRAQGCQVLAVDFDDSRLALAREMGAATCNPGSGADAVAEALLFSRGRGVDGTIITASTSSSEPVSQSARMCRKRGRIILVGVTGLELDRAEFYDKELTFQVSCSYGPGRYDSEYEEKGNDYPIGFVRWTEQRNFEAVLDLMAAGAVRTDRLISHRFPFEDAKRAYDALSADAGALGILLEYPALPEAELLTRKLALTPSATAIAPSDAAATLSVIGAGNYASRVLLPAFRAAGAQFGTLVTANGLSAAQKGEAFAFAEASTQVEAALEDSRSSAIVVATRHDSHADLVCRALEAGKHVFVEKPLAIDSSQLERVEAAVASAPGQILTVGFNRRFAPHVRKASDLLSGISAPKAIVITVNAGAIPATHWTQDPAVGGGRIIGEACHFIDLARHLTLSPIVGCDAVGFDSRAGDPTPEDKASLTLRFADGSFATILYLANGASSFPKERIEVFVGGRIIQIDNFRRMRLFGWPGGKSMNLWRQDKGQSACAAAFLGAIRGERTAPIPVDQLIEVARATIELDSILRR
jgi:predicted dehydrogenase/threonine dehydrogenase-like Zn-dependent dehydrogenase